MTRWLCVARVACQGWIQSCLCASELMRLRLSRVACDAYVCAVILHVVRVTILGTINSIIRQRVQAIGTPDSV